MTQEDRKLLLKDLCARLPYGVKVHIQKIDDNKVIDNEDFGYMWLGMVLFDNPYHEIKPYLRPMSSMTDDEVLEYLGMLNDIDKSGLMNQNFITKVVDWLDKKMFDHRGLLPKGLALEATKEMYHN